MFIIGIDAGGTKTLFALFDYSGKKIDSITSSTCHYMKTSDIEMSRILKQGIETLCKKHNLKKQEVIICFGMAGYGADLSAKVRIKSIINKSFADYAGIYIANDAQIALEGTLGEKDGIVIIAGTGSIAYAKKSNKIYRAGGFGYTVGDEGSGYWIGKQALSLFSKQADGRISQGKLYEIMMDNLKLKKPEEIITYVNNVICQERDKIAKLSSLVYLAAKAGDPYAKDIFIKAAQELAQLVNCLARKIEDKHICVSYWGGVFKAEEFLLKSLSEYMNPNCYLKKPVFAPEKGAFLIAKKAYYNDLN